VPLKCTHYAFFRIDSVWASGVYCSNRRRHLWGRDAARSQDVVEVSLLDQRAWRAGQKNFTALEQFGSVNWGELHVNGPGEPFRAVKNAVSSGPSSSVKDQAYIAGRGSLRMPRGIFRKNFAVVRSASR
jgi:hypothetical protein